MKQLAPNNSTIHRLFLVPALVICLLTDPAFTADKEEESHIQLDTITVTSSRFPRDIFGTTRSVSVLNADDVTNAPARNVVELLDYADGVDVQRRGARGAQADISVRGSTFEQTAIMIDGVRVNDPQTGHHDMDIPLTISDIERIEVLRGHGSSLYGSDAVGGVINIITKTPTERRASIEGFTGDNTTRGSLFNYSDRWKNLSMNLSAETRATSGYRYDTDSDITTLFAKTLLDLPEGEHSVSIGYTDKEFGAYDFYTPGAGFPSREWTVTRFAAYGGYIPAASMTFRPSLYYRRHEDKFVLDITDPGFYLARHTTEIRGGSTYAEIPLQADSILSIGVDLREEEIDSTALGEHINNETGVAAEVKVPVLGDVAVIDVGVRADTYSAFDTEVSPSLGGLVHLADRAKLRFSAGRAFRVPSFTELYYNSPANVGNADLDPEKAWCYEIGIDYSFIAQPVTARMTVFYRDQDDLIDWIKLPPTAAQWTATNITSAETSGLEAGLEWTPHDRASISAGYTHIDTDISLGGNYLSKYVLNHPEHHIGIGLHLKLPYDITNTIRLSYKDREEGDNYTVTDIRLSKDIANTSIFLSAANLFDVNYEDLPGIPQPGRWVIAGATLQF